MSKRGSVCTVCMDKDRREIEELRALGASYAALAKAYSLTREQVRGHFRTRADRGTTSHVGTVTASEDPRIERANEAVSAAEAAGYEVASVRIEDRDGTWGIQKKGGAEGELSSERKGVSLTLRPQLAQRVTEIRQAAPVVVNLKIPRPPKQDKADTLTAIIVPDLQCPFVDHSYLDVLYQITEFINQTECVDRVIWVGDNADLSGFSSHRTAPALLDTAVEGFDVYVRHMATMIAIASNAAYDWILGNHEQRLVNWLVDHAPRLVALRAGVMPGEDDEPPPALSLETLCRTEELGVNVVGPYPEGAVWLNDSLRVIHGHFTGPNSANKYLTEMEVSTISGHGHHIYNVARTVNRGPQGARQYIAASPGCGCLLDGSVPSTKSGVTSRGNQGKTINELWQQGIGVVRYNPAGGEVPDVHIIQVVNGVAHYNNRRFVAQCDKTGELL